MKDQPEDPYAELEAAKAAFWAACRETQPYKILLAIVEWLNRRLSRWA